MPSPTDSSRPTAWLAPPPGLLPSNHPVKIEPVPLAVSATLALIVGAVFIILFNYAKKEMFLQDKIMTDQAEEADYENLKEFASVTEASTHVQRPPPSRIDKSMISEPTLIPKTRNDSASDAMRAPSLQSPRPVQEDLIERNRTPLPSVRLHKPKFDFDSNLDSNTLHESFRNSAYYPPRAGSDVSVGSDAVARSGFRFTDRSRVHGPSDEYSFVPSKYVPKHLPGDAY